MQSTRLGGFIVLGALLAAPAFAQSPSNASPSIAIHLEPALEVPLVGDGATFLSLGGGLKATGELALAGSIPAFVALEASYDISTVNLAGTLVHTFAGGPGIGISLPVGPRVTLRGMLSGGYYETLLSDAGSSSAGGDPYIAGVLGANILLSPALDVGLSVGYRQLFGLDGALTATLGTSIYLGNTSARAAQLQGGLPGRAVPLGPRKPDPDRGLRISATSLDSIFPVLRNYYDDHPIGSLEILNQEKVPITALSARLVIKGYMDSEKDLTVPAEIAPGARAKVDLYALLNKQVMGITESEKAPLQITLSYSAGEDKYEDTQVRTVTIYGRNNMTWDDTRKAAAFVTRNDPTVQAIVRNVTAATTGLKSEAISRRLLTAIAVHDVTLLAKLQYRVDPTSAYATLSGQKSQIDTLNFPVQTLDGLGGDCDDLSILYSALLEAMGVPTAFVTAPGHIYVAFDLDATREDVAKIFSSADDVFARNGHVWVPIEVTERSKGFMDAWRLGAQEWKTDEGGTDFGLYPLEEAFSIYSPVQATDDGPALKVPESAAIAAAVKRDVAALRERELAPALKRLSDQDPQAADPSIQNKIAILRARFGDLDAAEAILAPFTRDPSTAYLPAVINLGSLRMMKGKFADALALFAAASARLPESVAAMVGVARAEYELGQIGDARATYEKVKARSPGAAAGIAYIGQDTGSGSTRAADAADRGGIVWAE
jgi:transglutaminase-like putative cysteine protease